MINRLLNLPSLRDEEEEEEKKKKLSGMDRLNAARGKTEEPAKKEEPAAPQQQLSGMERLNAAREKQKTEPQTAAPQISNTYREVDKENGRIRTRPADLSTPSWQDDPEEMAAELNMLGATLEDTGSKLTTLSKTRAMANSAVQNIGNQIEAYETKLGMLADTAANSTDAGERQRAQQESKALNLYYQKAKLAQERYTARANELNSQFDTLAGQYESALQKYQAVEPKYTRRLGLGDSKATRYQQEADKLIRQADTLSRGAATAESNAQAYGVSTGSAGKIQADRDTADRLTAQARDLLNKADREREYYSTYQYMQYMDQLNQFRQDPEFEAKSKADPALMQLEWSGPYGLKLNPEYKDIDYAIINGSQDAYRASIDPETFNANDKAYLQNLTAEERTYYNYVYKTQGKAKADEFIKQITPQLTTKQREKDKTWWQDYARNQWGAASAFSVLEKPMAIQTLAMKIADYANDGKIDTNAAYDKFATIPTDIRAVAAEKYDEKGAAVYQQVMSMADNVYNRLITGGFGMSSEATTGMLKFLKGMTSPTIMLMMGEAAADSIIANKNLGMDDDRALILGIGAGLIEGLTENVSMEQLLNPGQLADGFLTTLAKMFTAEASEEGAADLLNWAVGSIYDMLSGMDESEYRQHIRQYVQQGMSTEEAARKAMQERYEELALDMLGGGISGGLFGGSNYVFNSTMYNAAMSSTGKSINTGNIQGMIDLGLQSPDGSVAKNTALEIQDRIAKGQRVSNAQVGRLALSVIDETVNANTDAAAAEAKAPETQASAEIPKTVLQQMTEKYAAEGKLTGRDARDILKDPEAKQTLIDAGLITGREINDSSGRTKVANAAEQYIRQQAEQQNAPPVPEQGLKLPAAEEKAPVQESKLQLKGAEGTAENREGADEDAQIAEATVRALREAANAQPVQESKLRLKSAEETEIERDARAIQWYIDFANSERAAENNAQTEGKTLTGAARLNAAMSEETESQQGRNSKTATVVENLRKNAETLLRGAPVATIDGNEIPKSGRATDRVMAFLSTIGNKVTRDGFGDVLFSRSKVKTAMIGHGASNAKVETIAAVPAVIKNGKLIDHIENYEGRGYDSYIFAAPVTYKGTTTLVGVVVDKDKVTGRYYVHEVVDSNGNIIMESTEPESTVDRSPKRDRPVVNSSSKLNIPQSEQTVNKPRIRTEQAEETLTPAPKPVNLLANSRTEANTNGQKTQTAVGAEQRTSAGEAQDGAALPDRDGGRRDGKHTDRPVGRLARGTKEWRNLPQREKAARRSLHANALGLRDTDGAELGIQNSAGTVKVYPESEWEDDLQNIQKVLTKATGMPVTYVVGPIKVNGMAKGDVRGVFTGNRIIIRIDERTTSAAKIAAHEAFHAFVSQNQAIFKDTMNRMIEKIGYDKTWNLIYKYVEKIYGITDIKNDNTLSIQAKNELVKRAAEDLFANSYAGINSWGINVQQFQQIARSAVRGAETSEATDRRTGPPGRPVLPLPEYMERGDNTAQANEDQRTAAERRQNENPTTDPTDFRKLGFAEAGEDSTAFVRNESEWDAEEQAAAEAMRKLGYEPAFFTGLLMKDGERVDGLIDGNRVLIQSDNRARSIQQIAEKITGKKLKLKSTAAEIYEPAENNNIIAGPKKDMRTRILDLFHIPKGSRTEYGSIINEYADKAIRNGGLTADEQNEMFDKLYNAGEIIAESNDAFQAARNAVRGMKIYVPESVKHEFGDDWGAFRREAFGQRIYLTDNPADKDVTSSGHWGTLSGTWPGIFAENETSETAMLETILEIAKTAGGETVTPYEWAQREAGMVIPEEEYKNTLRQSMKSALQEFAELTGGQMYSMSESEEDSEYLEAVESGDMKTAQQMVDKAAKQAGYTIHAYHGTGRADRVGTVFRADRATSGPMAFFTDNKEIAENYSRDKRDTSIAYDTDYDSYETQFRSKHTKTGKDFAIYKMWGYIPMAERAKIAEKAKHVRIDVDGDGEIIYDPEATEANGGWKWQVKEFHGDILKALNEQWLNSGHLFNEEENYLKVLELAGVTDALRKAGFEMPRYMNPDYREEAVYDVLLRIQNPFDATSMIDEDFIQGFEDFAADNEEQFQRESYGADLWDKNSVSAEDFVERMQNDLESGVTHAWTSIPDVMTAYLKSLDYDGIKDAGGKNGGQNHTVWIPFSSEQIKSADAVTYDNNGNVVPLSERFNPEKSDIRYSISDSDDASRRTAGTQALDKLGIKLAGSKGRYHLSEQLIARDKAAKSLNRAIKKAERKLKATAAEKEFASGLAAGIYKDVSIPKELDRAKVLELADYYWAEKSMDLNMLQEVRADINAELQTEAEDLLKDVDNFKKLGMLWMNERTPDRIFRAMFGAEKGREIFDWLIRPEQMNEAEKTRWHEAQLDKVRKFEDSKGKTRALTREESELTMLVMEGKAAAAMVADMEANGLDAAAVKNAAENIRNGEDPADAAEEFGLKAKEKDLAKNYAVWMDTQEKLKNADSTIIETAAETYSQIFDEFYDAINDFLVAHGYEPIGYIKGYAPHMQPEETQNLLEKAFDKMGISLGNDKAQGLPASIAGETAYFKPNKRWDPYFLHRTGTLAEYDIEKAYQSYVGYMADILFHTDDIMRARNFERMIRKTFADENIRDELDWIGEIRNSPTDERLSMLRDAGKVDKTTMLSAAETAEKLNAWEEELFNNIKEDKNYNNLVMWVQNWANILAGKQSMADRGWEYSVGRNSLNFANRLQAAFQRSLVAGSLTSALNQTAQLPMIKTELGDRWYYQAALDILRGNTKNFWRDSDFLTGKHGVDMLTTENWDKFINALFTPSTVVDNLVSTIAVRGAYLKAVNQGQSYSEAMKTADDFGRKVMGSREKGTRPLAYESKGLFSRMIHMFQVEAANSWDHIASDLPYEIKEIAKTQGKGKAARTLAALLLRGLLSAFLLNRITEEVYGGTPAPFDVIGLAMNFVASGKGMTTNKYLKTIIDNGLEQIGQDRFFGTEDVDTEFDVGKGLEELGYNVMNDVPLLRNLAGVLGLGDQTVPLPGAGGEFTDMYDAAKDLIQNGNEGKQVENLIRATLKFGFQLFPAGRQITKTAEGIEAAVKGGSYSKKGKLQYSIDTPADKARSVLFGKNSTEAAREHWASGEGTMTEKQTDLVSTMRGWGMSGAEARKVINDIGSFEADPDPDNPGKTINGSKKAKVVDYIDGLKQLTSKQKDQLYLAQGYAESGLDETPWHKGGGSGTGKTYAPADQSKLQLPPSARMNDQDRELWDMESHGGNVNLRTRKTIPVTRENIGTVKGWGMDSQVGDYMTVASQTYRDGNRAIVVTPILPNGKLMTQAELDDYMDSLRGSDDYADADDRGIILGVFDDGNWQQNLRESDAFAERIHELHEEREEKRKAGKPRIRTETTAATISKPRIRTT